MHKQQSEFTCFIQRERRKLINYVRQKITGISEMDAEDIVADVLFNVYNRLAADQQVENLAAYLYRSVKNKILDHFRKPPQPFSLDAPDEETGLPKVGQLIDENVDVEKGLEEKEFASRFRQALNKLNSEQRAVWIATELEGHTMQALALKWQEPIGTLLSRKSRATQVLRKELRNEIM